MDIQTIFKNIMKRGPKETFRLYKKRNARKKKMEQETVFLEEVALLREQRKQPSKKRFEQLDREIFDLLKSLNKINVTSEEQASVYQSIQKKEKEKGYGNYLKTQYIKWILPRTYQKYAKDPIENKMVFLQPRKGLNPSCKYMYSYIQKQGKYKVELHELKRGRVPLTVYYLNAVKFIRSMATAKACFEHESNALLGYVDIRSETKVVQLWHGCGILKKIGLSTADMKSFKSMKTYEEFPEYNKYDIVTTASPELTWVFEEFMGIDRKEGIIQPIGVSRTDEFFDETYIKKCYDKIHKKVSASGDKKIILYAPTYRGVGQKREAPDKLDIQMLAENLSDEYILIIKQHQTVKHLPPIPEKYKNTFAYDMTHGWGMDINELMTVSDICISDYSSLIFEFALFERPIMFFVYDLEEYIDHRGLYYEFDEISPGPVCKTNEEVIDYIKNIKERFNKKEITDFKYKFMRSCDGHATERIMNYIETDEK